MLTSKCSPVGTPLHVFKLCSKQSFHRLPKQRNMQALHTSRALQGPAAANVLAARNSPIAVPSCIQPRWACLRLDVAW